MELPDELLEDTRYIHRHRFSPEQWREIWFDAEGWAEPLDEEGISPEERRMGFAPAKDAEAE